MRIKKALIVTVFVFSLLLLAGCWNLGRNQVDPAGSWKYFFEKSLFRSPVQAFRRYEGAISGSLVTANDSNKDDNPSLSIKGVLGFGANEQQQLIHFEGRLADYNLDIDILKEKEQIYVRSYSDPISGLVIQSPLTNLLGVLSNTDRQFVRLSDFVYQNRLAYVIEPSLFFQQFSGAISLDPTKCKAICPLIIDKDFIPDKGNNLIINFLQALEKQDLQYNPTKQILAINLLQNRSAGINGTLSKSALKLMRNNKQVVNKVYTLNHELLGNRHVLDLIIDHDGDRAQTIIARYDSYPDGRDLNLSLSRADGLSLDLEGKRYEVGHFLPIDKGAVLDIYGLLGKNN